MEMDQDKALNEENRFAGLVLAAGKGERLRPLTLSVPKPLIRVGRLSLLDLALRSLPMDAQNVAVNASYLADQIQSHLVDSGVHVVVESSPLGSAGAVGNLRGWIAGRDLMVRNADMWFDRVPTELWSDWSGENPRLLVQDRGVPSDFGTKQFLGWSILPSTWLNTLQAKPSSLLNEVWLPAAERGLLELVPFDGLAIDCGTHDDLARAREAQQAKDLH